ncbi:MAG: AraC family transcriptional regulator [Tepidisphaeraceae bacterium]
MRKAGRATSSRLRARPVIGIAVDAASAYGRGIMRGIMQYANAQRRWEIYSMLRGTLDERPHAWPRCNGAICAGVQRETLDSIRGHSRHCIICSGSAIHAGERHVVCLDDVATGVMAAEHLAQSRPRSFAFIGLPASPHSINRQRGFLSALKTAHAGRIAPSFDHPGITPNLEHWPAMIAWARDLPRPAAVFAVDDTVAYDLAAACLRAEIAVPEHVSILGVNNDDLLCESAWPPLSSIDAGFPRIGYAAGHLMDRLLSGKKLSKAERQVKLPPLRVVRRRSTDALAVTDPTVADALRFIREHACDPCSVDDVLNHLAVSRRLLELKFTRTLGHSPKEQILSVQMEAARSLLLQPGMTLPTIAERCGFSDQSAFGRAFRRTTGRSPGTYRRDAVTGQ